MPRVPVALALIPAATTVAGIVVLALDPGPYSTGSAVLVASGAVVVTILLGVGMLIARSRWAQPLGLAVGIAWVGFGAAADSAWAVTTLVGGAATIGGYLGPWPARWLRRLPRSDGPPPAATALLVLLAVTPVVAGASAMDGDIAVRWALSLWSLALALAFGRTVPGSLWAVRIGHPVVVGVAATFLPAGSAAALLVMAFAVSALAWARDVGDSARPLILKETGPMRFPPELAPAEILDAAGIDSSGRRKEPR